MNNPDLSSFCGLHANVPAVIVGSAPDLDTFDYKNFNGIVIGVGDSPIRGHKLFNTDYWVFANSEWILPWVRKHSDAIKFVNPKRVFIATAVFANQNLNNVDSLIFDSFRFNGEKLVFYDQRHFENSICVQGYSACCRARDLLEIKTPIQEVIKSAYKTDTIYSQGSTVFLHALALAVLMKCDPIHIIGVKIPILKKDYIYYRSKNIDRLIKFYGSTTPFEDSMPKNYIEKMKSFFKRKVRYLKYLIEKINKKKLSEFASDRVIIKNDISLLVDIHTKSNNGTIINHSKNSLLCDIDDIKSS